MTIQDFRDTFVSTLKEVYPPEEVHSMLYVALEHFLGMSRIEVSLSRKQALKDAQRLLLEETLERLQQQEPLQYILGKTAFYDLEFLVDSATLIPRPETEELVRWIIETTDSKDSLKILDIGTGSGCIAVSLAKNLPKASVKGYDISKEAIRLARQNAHRNTVNVHFECMDILSQLALSEDYEIIVSNPPYVRELEKAEIQSNVLDYEPHTALFVSDQDPLIFYRKIAELASKHLKPGGTLFLEINQYLGKETVLLLKSIGFLTVELKQDMFGKDRMIKASMD